MNNEILSKNSYYEGLIQNLYGGSSGMFVSFMKLFYQYNQIKMFSPEKAEIFEKIMRMELENCTILGQILLKLGGDNKYYSSAKKFISGFNVDYSKTLSQIFLNDVESFELHVIELKNLISKIENLQIRDKLKVVLSNKKTSLTFLRENYFKNNVIN